MYRFETELAFAQASHRLALAAIGVQEFSQAILSGRNSERSCSMVSSIVVCVTSLIVSKEPLNKAAIRSSFPSGVRAHVDYAVFAGRMLHSEVMWSFPSLHHS